MGKAFCCAPEGNPLQEAGYLPDKNLGVLDVVFQESYVHEALADLANKSTHFIMIQSQVTCVVSKGNDTFLLGPFKS